MEDPDHIELVPVGRDIVHIHRPGYCAFYTYPFITGYTLTLPSLAVDFCSYYEMCPAQLSPYIYKLFLMPLKYKELAGRGISLQHLLHLFVLNFHRGTVMHLYHRGTKGLVVKMHDKINRRFWENFFYMRTEHVVLNPDGFPEMWNFSHKFLFLFLSLFF